MKIIKFLTAIPLFWLMIIFIGEVYVWNLESFETGETYVTFYLNEPEAEEKMKADIKHAAEQNNIGVYVIDRHVISLFEEEVTIYCSNQELPGILKEKHDIKEGIFDSIFLGKVKVEICRWEDIARISDYEYYYLHGSQSDILNFKRMLIDQYAGCFPREGRSSMESHIMIGALWACLAVFLLLLTLFEIAQTKKKVFLRFITGEKIEKYILNHIFVDIILYTGIFALLFLWGMGISNVFYGQEYTVTIFFLFLFLNSALYLLYLRMDYKQDTGTKNAEHKVLRLSYGFHILSSLLVVMILTGCVEMIGRGMDYNRQEEFFRARSCYSYITVKGFGVEEVQELHTKFFELANQSDKAIGMVDLKRWESKTEYILAMGLAKEYLQEIIPTLKSSIKDKKIYFLIPEKEKNDSHVIKEAGEVFEAYYYGDYEYDIITYRSGKKILSISNTGKIDSNLKKDPVIIIFNSDSLEGFRESMIYLGNATMYRFTEEEVDRINSKGNMGVYGYTTNVYENYLYYQKINNRNLLMACVFLFLILLLQGGIINHILYHEYRINAKKLLLLKINGYSFFYRHKKIMCITGSFLILLVSLYFLGTVLDLRIRYAAIAGILLFCMEIFYLIFYTEKLENLNISKIFKGGGL